MLLHVFGMWEKSRVAGGNKQITQTVTRDRDSIITVSVGGRRLFTLFASLPVKLVQFLVLDGMYFLLHCDSFLKL